MCSTAVVDGSNSIDVYRLIMEREAAMAEVEEWFRYLQATAADAGQGMVNVLVDILWAFKLRATAGRIYDLAIRLDIYPRNFSRYGSMKLLLVLRLTRIIIRCITLNKDFPLRA